MNRGAFLFLSCIVSLAPMRAGAKTDPAVETIEKTYQNTKSLQAEFVQSTRISLLEKTVTRPGRIFYQSGGKLRIEYAGDKMTHYITDGSTLWIFYPKSRETESYSLKESGLPEEALKFLTDLGELRKYFSVKTKDEKYILKPKKKSTYSSLTCLFGEDHYLKEITIHNLSGNTSHYSFFNLQTGLKLSPKLFRP